MKKAKKVYKGWVDPMCTPYGYKKAKQPNEWITPAMAAGGVGREAT